MADFTSGFWSWFIIIPTIAGLIGLVFLIQWMSSRKGAGESTGHVWDENLRELNNPLPRWWLNMFYITLVFAAIYLVLYPGLGSFAGILGWSQTKQYEDEVAYAEQTYGPLYDQYLNEELAVLVDEPEAIKIGERLFSTYCTTCHGSDARGVRGYPNLRDTSWIWGGTPEAIHESIRNGRNAAMPPWEGLLDYQDIFNVTEYVRSLSGRKIDSVVAFKGKQIFDKNCALCHGADGKGNQALGAANLTDNIWLYGGSQKNIQETITKGRSGRMPPHKEFLGDAKIHLLAAYVFSLSVNEQAEQQ
jgi:cytochrome c oxidase cbb3-type subunit 3